MMVIVFITLWKVYSVLYKVTNKMAFNAIFNGNFCLLDDNHLDAIALGCRQNAIAIYCFVRLTQDIASEEPQA
jgi:hypothetical protein